MYRQSSLFSVSRCSCESAKSAVVASILWLFDRFPQDHEINRIEIASITLLSMWRSWETTLATAETSFVVSERHGRGRVRWYANSERRSDRNCCVARARARVRACVCVCAYVCERERGEVNKVPDMVSCDRRECHFTYTHSSGACTLAYLHASVCSIAPSYAAYN